jgi:hypothetical protein
MNKKYIVKLTEQERQSLEALVNRRETKNKGGTS